MTAVNLISTSELATRLGIEPKRLYAFLIERGLISSDGDEWMLSQSGRLIGGVYKDHPEYGYHIAWPETLVFEELK